MKRYIIVEGNIGNDLVFQSDKISGIYDFNYAMIDWRKYGKTFAYVE